MSLGDEVVVSPPATPVQSGGAAIVTRGLTKVYRAPRRGRRSGGVDRGGLRAVDAIDLAVARGEIFGLLGPNGAGKTTTIGMLTTRVVPTGGAASVGGIDVYAQPHRVKQEIGVVPQTNTLDRSISVRENLYYHARYFGIRRREAAARADALLERFQLTDKRDQMVEVLSGGMAQRLMIARALLHQPAVLFLDEPTTGLDPQSRIALWDQLRDLHADGQTILLTTHHMEEADQLCDRLAIMDHGRILALGAPGELKRTVDADRIVRVTIDEGTSNGSAGRLQRLATTLATVDGVRGTDVHDDVVRVFAGGGDGLLPRLVRAAEDDGAHVRDLSVADPTLETVFIAMTGRDLRE